MFLPARKSEIPKIWSRMWLITKRSTFSDSSEGLNIVKLGNLCLFVFLNPFERKTFCSLESERGVNSVLITILRF